MSSPIGARLWGHVVNAARYVANRSFMSGAQSAVGHSILSHATNLSSTTSSSFKADHLNLHGIETFSQTATGAQQQLSGTGSSSTGGQIRMGSQNLLTSVRRAEDQLSIYSPSSRVESSQELQNAGVDRLPGGENLSFEMQIEQWKREAPEGENRSKAAELILAYARREHSELFHQASSLEHSEELMLDVGVLPAEEIDPIENVGVYSENSRFFLNLDRLNLSSLPPRFEELTSIEILSVAENRFTEMPDSVAKLPQLRELDLRNNCLTLVPSALKNAAELTHLFLAGNRIDQIAEWMLQSKLIFCDIFDLEKQRLIFQKAFPKLLDWEDDAPTATEREERVKVSDKILDELDKPSGILLLKDHNLTSLPDIFDLLPNIDLLDVSMNRLETLPESIKNLKKLKTLYLQNNSFSTLPSTLGDLKQLELILCTFNPLKNLPPSLKGCSSLTIQLDSPDSREKSLIWDELSTNYNLAWDLKGITLSAFRAKWKPLEIWHSREKFFTALTDWNHGPKEKIRQSIMSAHDFREKNLSLSLYDVEIFPWVIFDLENLEELHLFYDRDCDYSNSLLDEVCQSKIQKISLPSHAKPSPLFLEHFEESDRERYHWTRKKGSERNALGLKASTDQNAALSEAHTVQVPPSSGARAEREPAFSKKDVHQASGPQTSNQQDRAMARLTRIIGHVEPAASTSVAENDSSGRDRSSFLSSLLTTAVLFCGTAKKISEAKTVNTIESQAVQSIQRFFRGHRGRNEAKRLREEAKRLAEAQKSIKAPMMRSRL